MKILLVEDEESLREIYGQSLMAEGFTVKAAIDGEDGLSQAMDFKPDLIVSDIMMPKISGFDMLDILRQTPETANVKVIMMTALGQENEIERGKKLGADKYLVKSQVTTQDLIEAVHTVLGQQQVQDERPFTQDISQTPSDDNSTSDPAQDNTQTQQADATTTPPADDQDLDQVASNEIEDQIARLQ